MTGEHEIYQRIGEEGFERLVKAFYRQIPDDDLLGPMYPKDDLVGAEQRLRDFLVGRFGGPPRYVELRGLPRLRMRLMPFPFDQAARDRCMKLMTASLEEADLPEVISAYLHDLFYVVATFMMNRQ